MTFWSGLLVMAFICWAWWDSTEKNSYLEYDSLGLNNAAAGISVSYVQSATNRNYGREEFTRYALSFGNLAGRYIFPVEFYRQVEPIRWPDSAPPIPAAKRSTNPWMRSGQEFCMKEPGDWICFIPHWLILLTAAAVWLALLLWRARRRNQTFTT